MVGPMAELFAAIQEDREPMNSGADNLRTLYLVEAAYESIAEGRAMRPRTPYPGQLGNAMLERRIRRAAKAKHGLQTLARE